MNSDLPSSIYSEHGLVSFSWYMRVNVVWNRRWASLNASHVVQSTAIFSHTTYFHIVWGQRHFRFSRILLQELSSDPTLHKDTNSIALFQRISVHMYKQGGVECHPSSDSNHMHCSKVCLVCCSSVGFVSTLNSGDAWKKETFEPEWCAVL